MFVCLLHVVFNVAGIRAYVVAFLLGVCNISILGGVAMVATFLITVTLRKYTRVAIRDVPIRGMIGVRGMGGGRLCMETGG